VYQSRGNPLTYTSVSVGTGISYEAVAQQWIIPAFKRHVTILIAFQTSIEAIDPKN
jgi:hypothetical protein